MSPTRRSFLKKLLAGGVALIAGGTATFMWLDKKFNPNTAMGYPFTDMSADGSSLPLTPACDDNDHDLTEMSTEGPFYTPDTPQRTNLREPGIDGIPMVLEGRVLSPECVPIAGAVLDFWSCDGKGVYDNEGFKLRGHQYTDSDGRFRLETVKPKDYEQFMIHRTPHIHVKVQGRETALLTTQLYFPDEPLNNQDGIFLDSLVMKIEESEDGLLQGRFDFVIA